MKTQECSLVPRQRRALLESGDALTGVLIARKYRWERASGSFTPVEEACELCGRALVNMCGRLENDSRNLGLVYPGAYCHQCVNEIITKGVVEGFNPKTETLTMVKVAEADSEYEWLIDCYAEKLGITRPRASQPTLTCDQSHTK